MSEQKDNIHDGSSKCHGITRRSFLVDTGMGFTGLALSAMIGRDAAADTVHPTTIRTGAGSGPHFAPRAKSVIWIFMCGGVSHIESFDVKPALTKYGGKSIEDTPFKDALKKADANIVGGNPDHVSRKVLMPIQTGYKPYGKSGLVVGDWFQHIGECADDLAVVRSLWTLDNDHGAQLTFQTGRHVREGAHPTVGSWTCYGLGTLNQNLPEYVVLGQPTGDCCGGAWTYGAAYLGPQYGGVRLNTDPAHPLPFLSSAGNGISAAEQADDFSLIGKLNNLAGIDYPDDQNLRARIKSYELAYQMQAAVPETLQIEKETDATRKLYGMDRQECKAFGEQCLAARRLVERGVRFVQIFHGGGGGGAWDAHSDIKGNHSSLSAQSDLPIAGLLKDLKQRGLLDETIVVWGTEFGRSPGAQDSGRDHHPQGFTAWLAGGGVKGGITHGATDEIGFHAVENRHYVTDIHATVLHQMGLDSHKLEVPGRKRLAIDHGIPITEILA